jgi:hypothetical protein
MSTTVSEITTGVPDPDRPGCWLVPPWRRGASFHEIVRHFLHYHLWHGAPTAHAVAYYEGYQAAAESASTFELSHPTSWQWYYEMKDCVDRCVIYYRDQQRAELAHCRARMNRGGQGAV